MRVGFVGLGNQGKPIAAHLAPSGFETTVYDLAEEPVRELVKGGAHAAASPREVAEAAEVVGVCVPEDKHVFAVMRGENGLLAGAAPGSVICIHSTILPRTAQELAAEAAPHDVAVLDACVTGGAARAVQKQLTYLVGGDAAALEKARPFLECAAQKVIHAGELGSGAKLKLCINLITYIQWAAAYESFELARGVGLPQEVLEEAGQSNGQLTPLMIAYLATHKMPAEVVASDGIQAMMRGYRQVAEKDMAWALALAREAGVSLPVGGLVSQLMGRLYRVEPSEEVGGGS
jgi:3-hydroxyisobutyrate dehydrogenase-like beta-hydroxyacid dehydrogenase